MLKDTYERIKSQAEKVRTMIQFREPPFEGDTVNTLSAMDGVLAIDDQTTLYKTARLLRKAGAEKRSDGSWSLHRCREKGYPLVEWEGSPVEGRKAGREPIYPFTKMEPGESVSFPNEGFKGRAYRAAMVYAHRTGKKFTGRLWTRADGWTGIVIERTDEGDQPKRVKETTDADAVKALIDWKAGVFVNDIIKATDAVETLQGIIPGVSPVKVGLLLRDIPGVERVRAYNGKGQVMVWVIRNLSEYRKMNGAQIWNLYTNPV